MRLQENETAPDFSLSDIADRIFDMKGNRNKLMMLSFFRYASCPLCNLRVHSLIQEYENLKDKLDIVMVF